MDVVVRDELYGVRDAFVMRTQICLAVSMEKDEIGDLLMEVGEDGGELEWVSEVEETRRARERVVRMG